MFITIPQSVQDYFQKLPQQNKVDALIGHLGQAFLPQGIAWEDLREHYKDLLITATARTDYAVLLFNVWDATWGPALAACKIIRAVPIRHTEKTAQPSPKVIWGDGLIRVYYDPRDQNALIYVETRYEGPDDGFQMFLWHGEQDDQQEYRPTLTVTARLGERWIPHIPDGTFEGWFVTEERAFPADRTDNTFDPEPMREAAEVALRALLALPR